MDLTQRPYKVWSCSRDAKKSLTATSFSDFVEKAKLKLGYGDITVSVRLEEDGTEVEDEDYFQALDDHTIFLLVRANECYHSAWEDGKDEVDFAAIFPSADTSSSQQLYQISQMLRYDLAKLVTLKDEEYQILVDAETEVLCSLLNCTAQETRDLQDASQRNLDDRREAKEAIELIKLISQRDMTSPPSETVSSKRKKPP